MSIESFNGYDEIVFDNRSINIALVSPYRMVDDQYILSALNLFNELRSGYFVLLLLKRTYIRLS